MAEAHRRLQKMIQERDSELEIKDEEIRIKDAEIRLLNKELLIWKAENALLTGQITTMEKVKSEQVHAKQENETIGETPNVIKNMKEEIQRLKEEKTDIEKTHNNIVEDMKNEITGMKKEKLAIQETHNDMVQSLRNKLSELKSKVNPEEEINQTENTGVIQNYKDRQNDETISQSTSDEENIDESKKEQNRPIETIQTGTITSATYRRKQCFRCGSQDHLIRSCKSACTAELKYRQDKLCEICKKLGHRKEDCWFKDQKDGQKRCFRCGSEQNLVKDCAVPRKTSSPLRSNIVAEHETMSRIENMNNREV